MLYDDEFVARLPDMEPRLTGAATVVWVCKCETSYARAMRRQIEEWFEQAPCKLQGHLYEDLRSQEEEHFQGALAELGVYDCLTRLGYDAEAQPKIAGRTPDFLLKRSDSTEIAIVEVTGLNESDLERETREAAEELERLLRRIAPTGYHFIPSLSPEFSGVCGTDVERIRSALLESHGGPFDLDLERGARVSALPSGHDGPSQVGRVGPGRWGRPELGRLRRAIATKVWEYKADFDKPFVVSVWNFTQWRFTEDELEHIWLGALVHDVAVGRLHSPLSAHEVLARSDGLVTQTESESGERANTRLSGLLFFDDFAGDELIFRARYLHNPFAERPLDPEIFRALRCLVPGPDPSTWVQPEWTGGPLTWHVTEY